MTRPASESIVTVTLNPTIDRIMEVPGFEVGGHLRGRLRSLLPAGKAINVSRALAALGVANTAVGWVGRASLDLFDRALAQSGVTARFTPIAGTTRQNITLIDPANHTETHVRDAGPTVTAAEVDRLAEQLASLAGEGVTFVFTGSVAPGVTLQQFGDLLDVCARRGARVAVDSSGDPLRTAAQRRLWLIKPNLLELADILGHSVDSEDRIMDAGRQLSRSIALVLITMGHRGAYCLAGEEVLRGTCPVPSDRLRSTVGCGDALLAGFLAGMSPPGASVESAFRQALAVAAASAMNERPAPFSLDDLHNLLGAASVSRVNTAG